MWIFCKIAGVDGGVNGEYGKQKPQPNESVLSSLLLFIIACFSHAIADYFVFSVRAICVGKRQLLLKVRTKKSTEVIILGLHCTADSSAAYLVLAVC